MPHRPSDGDLHQRRPGSGSGSAVAQRTVAERLGCRTLRGSWEWSGSRVRFPAAAGIFALCFLALQQLVADPRPTLPRNTATCVASGAAIYNPAAATYTTDGAVLWAAASAHHRRRSLKPSGCCWLLMLFLLSGDIESNPGPELRIFQQNVCSLKNKLGTLRTHAGELIGYDAICLTETWLGPHVADSELQLRIASTRPQRLERL